MSEGMYTPKNRDMDAWERHADKKHAKGAKKEALHKAKSNTHPKDYKTNTGNGRSDAKNRAADNLAIKRDIHTRYGNGK